VSSNQQFHGTSPLRGAARELRRYANDDRGEIAMNLNSKWVPACAIALIFCSTSALAAKIPISAAEYGDKWSFTVSRGELECKLNAVVLHTSKGTYSLNGQAMETYRRKYPEWREIAKPYPGLESDPSAKMPPPHDLIRRGLDLCN
jgi:hypothetical protein